MKEQCACADTSPQEMLREESHAEAWESLKKEIFIRDGIRRRMDAVPEAVTKSPGASQHERLMIWLFLWSWGLLMIVILGLHFYNYELETKTSSTSPTHKGFYEVVGGSVSGSAKE